MPIFLLRSREGSRPSHGDLRAGVGASPANDDLQKGLCSSLLRIVLHILVPISLATVCVGAAAQGNPAKQSGAVNPSRSNKLPAGQRRGNLLWKFDLGAKHRLHGPVLGKKNIFVAHERSALYALDKTSGVQNWRRELFPTGLVYQEGTVYMTDAKGLVRALDAATGATKWEFKTGGGGVGAPKISDGIVYALSNFYNRDKDSWTGYLWLLDKQGEEVGRFVKTDVSFPAKFVVGAKLVFVVQAKRSLEYKILGVDKTSAKLKWESTPVEQTSLVAYADKRVLVAEPGHHTFLTFAPAESPKALWQHTADFSWRGLPTINEGLVFAPIFKKLSRKQWLVYFVARDLATGRERWRLEMSNWKRAMSPAADSGVACVGTADKLLHGIDTNTGKTKWVYAPPKKVDRSGVRALDCKVAGEIVLAWDNLAHLFVLERETGELRWAAVLPRQVKSLAVEADTVYTLTADGSVSAYQ